MKYFITVAIALVIILLFVGYFDSEEIEINQVSIESLVIDLEEKEIAQVDRSRVGYYKSESGGKEYITAMNMDEEALQFFELKSQLFHHQISVTHRPEDFNLLSYCVLSDTQLVIGDFGNTSYYFYSQGLGLIDSIQLVSIIEKGITEGNGNANSSNPILKFDNYICVSQRPVMNGKEALLYSNDFIVELAKIEPEFHASIVNWNSTNSKKTHYRTFPEEYLSKGWKQDYKLAKCLYKDKIIYQRFNDEFVEVRKFNGRFIKQIQLVPSEYLEHADTFKASLSIYPKPVVDYLMEVSGYRGIIYDEYRNLFYRIVALCSDHEYDTYYFSWSDVKPFSIQIFTESFQLIDEILLPPYKYNMKVILPVKEGLLISTDNSFNEERQSGALNFELFEVVLN